MSDLVANACSFLESLQRFDLSVLLRDCEAAVERRKSSVSIDGLYFDNVVTDTVVVRACPPIDEALRHLPPQDRRRLAEAVASGVPGSPSTEDVLVESLANETAQGAAAVLAELLIQRATMISVATGGDRIQDVDDYYRAREARIQESAQGSVGLVSSLEQKPPSIQGS
jgi:hypothetical protein